jgi:tetraacyldisaccharide 4'-kinase
MARATAVIIVGKDEHLLTKRLTKPFFEARLLPHIGDDFPDLKPYFAFAGIARPEKFFASCHEVGLKLREMKSFPDHHAYTTEELESLVQGAEGKNLQLLTTMKDWVRLPDAFKPKVAALEVELTFRDPMGLLHTIQSSTLAARDPS